ncbi:hypothetical protein B9Z19DRAFT_1194875 [Tuber borchii]|uniref:Uncharacterized protein n=1 Tax=Tuber borchii TaxID=42251 RepID=A0A2T6ZLA9_TUBBO|nr:hypothetical protein B9Z19DRAFT_1194875 [Tuber borchii]
MLRLKGVKDDIAKVKTVQDRQGRSITDMRGHILAHTKELIRLDNNQLARMGNRNAVQGDGIIVALAGVGNAPIIGFPGTIEELDALDDPTIEALILALGIQVDVGAPMNLKKAIVRYYIGVPPA